MSDELLACDAHRALVERAWSPDASERDLLSYAEEAATCPDCEQLLARRLSVHPAVLRAGGRTEDHALPRPLPALGPEPTGATPPRWSVGWVAAAAFAAGALLSLLASAPFRGSIAAVPAAAAAIATVPVAPSPDVPRPTAAVRQPTAPAPTTPRPTPPREAPPALPAPVRVAESSPPSPPWPLPPWVDLAGPIAKAADGSVRDLQVALTDPAARVGDAPGLDLIASHPESVAVCVAGPEAGMVWRGTVPSGRTGLTRDDHRVRFRFERPGTYTLVVSRDVLACDAPVHRLTIEVAP